MRYNKELLVKVTLEITSLRLTYTRGLKKRKIKKSWLLWLSQICCASEICPSVS